jgi:hypothetical protein
MCIFFSAELSQKWNGNKTQNCIIEHYSLSQVINVEISMKEVLTLILDAEKSILSLRSMISPPSPAPVAALAA